MPHKNRKILTVAVTTDMNAKIETMVITTENRAGIATMRVGGLKIKVYLRELRDACNHFINKTE